MMQRLSPSDQRTLKFGGYGVAAILLSMVVVFPAMDHWKGVTGDLQAAQDKIRAIQTGYRTPSRWRI